MLLTCTHCHGEGKVPWLPGTGCIYCYRPPAQDSVALMWLRALALACFVLLPIACVALSLPGCSAAPVGPTVVHIVRTGDLEWPYALDAHIRLCKSRVKPPAPGCDLATYGYRAATLTEAP